MTTDTALDVVISEESFDTSWPDAAALIAKHWHEIATYEDIPLDVDSDTYRKAEAAGRLCILTVRSQGQLVGYAVFILTQHLHYRGSMCANQDVFYLDPSFRGRWIGVQLIKACDRLLKSKGVQVVTQHVKMTHPILGRLLAREGYEPIEQIYSKRLDR